MKILFTADLHIKLGQKNVPIEWAKNRYDMLFREICNICAVEKVDLLILGGDTFDRLPNMAELELYFDFMMRIRCETVIYSGNHEADKRNTTFLSNLKDITYNISAGIGSHRIHIIDDFKTIHGIDFIPYNKLKEYHPADIDFHSDILCTHVRGAIPPHVQPEVDLKLFERWKLVLAGDLHSHSNSQLNIVYPGSPITTSFHRNIVDTGVLIVDTESVTYEWVKLELPQLLRKTVEAGEDMPVDPYHHVIYEVTGDMSQLANVVDSGNLDKKIVNKSSDSALILDTGMRIDDELLEYLLYVLELDEGYSKEVIKELLDNVSIDL